MVLRPAGGEGVPQAHELGPQRRRVEFHLPRVGLKLGRRDLEQLRRDPRDLVLVRSPLQRREVRLVDPVLEPPLVLPEEDHARPRPPQGLMGRCRHDVAQLERGRLLPRRHQPGNVRDRAGEGGRCTLRSWRGSRSRAGR